MRSLLKFIMLLIILIFSLALVVPFIVLVVTALDDPEDSLIFKMYKEI